jgi:hypothetical protein
MIVRSTIFGKFAKIRRTAWGTHFSKTFRNIHAIGRPCNYEDNNPNIDKSPFAVGNVLNQRCIKEFRPHRDRLRRLAL